MMLFYYSSQGNREFCAVQKYLIFQSGQAIIDRTGNIGSRQNAGISVSAQHTLAKWWTAILYSDLYYSKFSGLLYGEQVDVSATTLLLNLNNQFSFHDRWGGEISGFYRTEGVIGQIVVHPWARHPRR